MADVSDVEQALAIQVTNLLYPQGSAQPSIAGVICRIYRGWPNSATLNADLSAGVVNVTVISDNEKHSSKTTTRYLPEWSYQTVQPTLTVSASGQTITVGGAAASGDVIGALIEGNPFVYRIVSGDTPPLVAANLCTAIQASYPAICSGSTITIPGAGSIIARVVADSSASYEGRRQEKHLRVVFWCPTPAIRDQLTAAVDAAVSGMSFLVLPDGTSGRITYRNSATFDQSQNALLYRRDLVYEVEYATIVTVSLPSMLFGAAAINGNRTYG